MTSGDTNDKTVALLKKYNNFGMDASQITLVQQGQGVPALTDNDATIAMDGPCAVSTKPHGHGDVHALLFSHGVAKKWVGNGIGWIAFFQASIALLYNCVLFSCVQYDGPVVSHAIMNCFSLVIGHERVGVSHPPSCARSE